MYVEADVLYSYIKSSDWLKKESERVIQIYKSLKTSVITITEIELVSKREFGEEFSNSVLNRLINIKKLQFIPLNLGILKKAIEYRKNFGLNIFDSIHAASTFKIKEVIISTDNKYDLIGEIKRIDPREI